MQYCYFFCEGCRCCWPKLRKLPKSSSWTYCVQEVPFSSFNCCKTLWKNCLEWWHSIKVWLIWLAVVGTVRDIRYSKEVKFFFGDKYPVCLMVLIGSQLDCLELFFILECQNQNQRNHFSQSQMTHTKQWTNQNSKYFHVTDAKRGKICANAFGFTYDRKEGHEFFKPLVQVTVLCQAQEKSQTYLSSPPVYFFPLRFR